MKEFAYEIYQYEVDEARFNENEDYQKSVARRLFRELTESDKPLFTLDSYKMVAKGIVKAEDSDFDALDKLFHEYNVAHPAGYRGRSISVSDVIKLNDKYYYCQPIGWDNITIKTDLPD